MAKYVCTEAESIRLNFAPSRLRSELRSRFEPTFCCYGFHNIILTPPPNVPRTGPPKYSFIFQLFISGFLHFKTGYKVFSTADTIGFCYYYGHVVISFSY